MCKGQRKKCRIKSDLLVEAMARARQLGKFGRGRFLKHRNLPKKWSLKKKLFLREAYSVVWGKDKHFEVSRGQDCQAKEKTRKTRETEVMTMGKNSKHLRVF